jgi:hypothetical protein
MPNSWYHRRIKWLQHWKECWRSDPEHMEEVRQRGVAAMQQGWKTRNENLREVIETWPPTMSKKTFRAKVKELIDSPDNLRRRKRKTQRPDSMINRLRSKGFVIFNPDRKLWLNRCVPDWAGMIPSDNDAGHPR